MKYLQLSILAGSLFFYSCGNKDSKKEDSKTNKAKTENSISGTTDANTAGDAQVQISDVAEGKPATFGDKFSYMQGLEMGRQMKELGVSPNTEYFALGVKHAIDNNKDFLTQAELMAMQQEVMKVGQEKMKVLVEKKKKEFEALGKKSKAAGEAFLAKNKTQPGVKSSPSGLQYQVLQEGSGKTPLMGDVVLIKMKGSLIDGTVFENTFNKEAMPIMIDKSIMPAWREALLMMKPGETMRIFAPSDLAYGDKGVFPQILPNTVMIFDIQLVENKGKMPQK